MVTAKQRELKRIGLIALGAMLMLTLVSASAIGAPGHRQQPVQPLMNPALGGLTNEIATQPRLAQTYPPQQQGPWSFRPPSPTNARGVPPEPLGSQSNEPAERYYGPSGQWRQPPPQYRVPSNTAPTRYPPARYGPYGRRPGASAQPSLEVKLLDNKPYVQEPVLLQLDVISSGNLATASPELSGFDAILLEELSGPRTHVRGSGRTREIVNTYLLALTPLRPGPLEVGPFEVSGTLAGGVPFSAKAESPTRFTAQPVVPSVQPWLPLQALQLTRELDDETTGLEEGRPVTLTLRMEATGGLGDQLPDLEPMLASSDFRSYRERTIVDSRLTDDGRQIKGVRTEVYTLVPYSGGRLQLPAVRINWWNVETAGRESSSVPIRSLSVAGEAGPFGFGRSSTSAESDDWGWFWIPIGGLLMLLLGYWAGVWYRTQRPVATVSARRGTASDGTTFDGTTPRLGESLRRALAGWTSALTHGLTRLDLRSWQRTLHSTLADRLRRWTPASMRVYRCALDAERAQSPSEWALLFQTSACQSLRTPSREPLPRVADRILRLRPGADAERVRALLQQLDIALYNGGELDIKQWKRALRRALRPGWGAFAGLLGNRIRRDRLPALNPTHERV
jgi:hypothetical protein